MTRTVYVKGKEYYVVTTTLEINGLSVPTQIHVDVSKLNKADKSSAQQLSNLLFNHSFRMPKPKAKTSNKPWYKFW
jgi:hypothetical protein